MGMKSTAFYARHMDGQAGLRYFSHALAQLHVPASIQRHGLQQRYPKKGTQHMLPFFTYDLRSCLDFLLQLTLPFK